MLFEPKYDTHVNVLKTIKGAASALSFSISLNDAGKLNDIILLSWNGLIPSVVNSLFASKVIYFNDDEQNAAYKIAFTYLGINTDSILV